uniref:Uncharacterized protein n=1 Tax=Arundo donax TaxID=35708 RepID=A0A0A8Z1N0_ARUDO
MAILFLRLPYGCAFSLVVFFILDALFFPYSIFSVNQHALSCFRVGHGNYALFCFA